MESSQLKLTGLESLTINFSPSSSISERSLISNNSNRITNGIVQIRNGFLFIQGDKGTWFKISIHEEPKTSGSIQLSWS